MNILGVIGARAGSKSIPDKNIRPLAGKPLFAWIAEAAQHTRHPVRLIMSTDSPKYAEIAKGMGVEVPFMRPAELAGDTVPDWDFLTHAAVTLAQEGWKADIILRLPPTAPLCLPEHIDKCIDALVEDEGATSSRTIVPASKHPYKMWRTNGAYLEPFLPESYTGLKDAHNLPRQSFPPAFVHVDVIALRWKTLVEDRSMAGERVRFVEIKKENAVDIDSEIDFLVAEELLKKRNSLS